MHNWNDYFTYKDGKLYWKEREANTRLEKTWNTRYAGKEAGSLDNIDGYKKLGVHNKPYMAHRVIYEMLEGPIPEGMQIDHINGVRDDNRIENLRVVTRQGNNKNARKRSDNSSGVTGVTWDKHANKWCAFIHVDGKRKHLGLFEDIEDAAQARKDAEKLYGFHENHGR